MKGQTHGGKGSAQRPTDQVKYEANWESIFSKTLKDVKVKVINNDGDVDDKKSNSTTS